MKKPRTDGPPFAFLANPEVVLDPCPQLADYWDLIFDAVLEWCDLVKYNFIMFISANQHVYKFMLKLTCKLRCV